MEKEICDQEHCLSSKRPFVVPVIAASIIWACLYILLRLLDFTKSPEWHSRCVALIHAVTVVLMSAWSGFIQGPWPFTDPGGPNTLLHFWTCTVCLGYFLYDFIWCIYFQTEGPVMFVHHALSIFGTFLVLFRGMNGTEMMATIFGAEFTNPLLQLRWFLRESGQGKSKLATIIDLLFVGLFTFLRIGIASALLYSHWTHPRPDLIARLGGLAIYLVGWIFWLQIINYAYKKYARPRDIRKQKDNVNIKNETVVNGNTSRQYKSDVTISNNSVQEKKVN